MKKRFALVALIGCLLVSCLALAGCGKVDSADYVGTWTMTEGTVEGQAYSADEMALLEATGTTVTLTIAEDGTFDFDGSAGTWEAAKTGLEMEDAIGTDYTATVTDGVLLLEDTLGNNSIYFEQ